MEEREVQSENAEGPMVLIAFWKGDRFKGNTIFKSFIINLFKTFGPMNGDQFFATIKSTVGNDRDRIGNGNVY